jgi:putative sterol carrier protein
VARPDFENATPEQLYEQVQAMDDDEFEELMNDPASRDRVLGSIIDALVGLFRPEKAEGVEAVIHVKLWDAPGGGYDHYELLIANQTCRLATPPEADPDLTLKVRPTDLRKLINGDTGPKRLAFQGRLRAIGDLGLGMKLPDLFAF